MYEEHNTVSIYNEKKLMCPHTDTICYAARCMAFVSEIDENGVITGRGRCGIVQPIREMSERDRARLGRKSHV